MKTFEDIGEQCRIACGDSLQVLRELPSGSCGMPLADPGDYLRLEEM